MGLIVIGCSAYSYAEFFVFVVYAARCCVILLAQNSHNRKVAAVLLRSQALHRIAYTTKNIDIKSKRYEELFIYF